MLDAIERYHIELRKDLAVTLRQLAQGAMVTVPNLNNGDAPIEQLPGPSSRKARHVPLLYHSSKVSACPTNARRSTLHSRGPSTLSI